MLEIKNCTKCNLHKNNPINCYPISGIGNDNMVITEKPNYGTILSELPDGIEYDYIKKIFKQIQKNVYYTHAIKCLGKYTNEHFLICKDWISKEIEFIKPNVIFTLGNASKIFSTKKISELVGKNILYNEYNVVHLYSINYILKKGKRESDLFIEIIKKYAS